MHVVGDVVWFGHGTVKSPLREVAELKGLLYGLQKARENAIDDLLMSTRLELLTQVRVCISDVASANKV